MGKQKYTENKKASNKKWDDANLKRSSISMSIELYDIFEKYCNSKNISKDSTLKKKFRKHEFHVNFIVVK